MSEISFPWITPMCRPRRRAYYTAWKLSVLPACFPSLLQSKLKAATLYTVVPTATSEYICWIMCQRRGLRQERRNPPSINRTCPSKYKDDSAS